MVISQLYVYFVIRKYLYEEEIELGTSFTWIFTLMLLSGWAFTFLTWVGSIFVAAELPRLGNDQLLNGLKEGVLIIEEDSNEIKFMNKSAKRLMTEFSNNFNISMQNEKNIFETQD